MAVSSRRPLALALASLTLTGGLGEGQRVEQGLEVAAVRQALEPQTESDSDAV